MPARGAGGVNGAAAVAATPAHKDYKFETLAKGLITLDSNNYMSWKKVIENFEYFRDWTPEWKVLTEAKEDYWDGVEEDDPEVKRSRKEAYMALYSSIPTSSSYHHLLSGVRRGDANQIWRNVTQIFMPGDTANKGTLRTELHTMSMASTRYNVSNFGAAVNIKVEQLALVGENVSDADKKNVFLDGLSKHFSFIVTLQRNNNDDYNKTHAKVIAHAKKENLLDVRDKGIYHNLKEQISSLSRLDIRVTRGTSREDHHNIGRARSSQRPEVCTMAISLDRTEEIIPEAHRSPEETVTTVEGQDTSRRNVPNLRDTTIMSKSTTHQVQQWHTSW